MMKKLMLKILSRSLVKTVLKVLKFSSFLLTGFGYALIEIVETLFKFLNHFFKIDWLIRVLETPKKLLLMFKKKSPEVGIPRIQKIQKQIFTKVSVLRSQALGNTKAKKKKETSPFSLFKKLMLFVSGSVFSIVFFAIPLAFFTLYEELPDLSQLFQRIPNAPTKIYDRNDKLLYEIYIDKKYEPAALEKIPDHVVKSTIAIEDSEFYLHKGIRPLSIMRAAKATVLDDTLQGASTITQQLVKNLLLTPEKTLMRKIKEAMLALMVEQRYTKDQILELYLNNISYGGTTWGIQSASKKYFGKNVWELDLSEASLLAGLPTAPSVYSPLNGDIELTKTRQKLVLNRMVELGYITPKEAESAYHKEIKIIPQTEYIRAPHFVMYVRSELEKKFGKRLVESGGLTVKTSLDLDFHEKVQQIVSDEVSKNAYLNITNGAAVVLDPKTGGILAYAGSRDYFYEKFGSFDILTAFRQPGSSIKPVTYALAFENGHTPASTVKDEKVIFKNEWETYEPVNYDGKYHGKVTLRQALANSYNIPAVKLASKLGADNVVALGKEMGLTNWEKDGSYGISVTLGGKEVRLLDLTTVYATFARAGEYLPTTPFLSIKDSRGYEILQKGEEKRVLSKGVSYLITNILSDSKARIPAFGTNNYLTIPGHTIAVKTGTTDSKRDNLTLGYTPSFVVGVWVGNNDNTSMNRNLASGLSGAAPMWNRIMSLTLEGKNAEKFEVPESIIVKEDKTCGIKEIFVKGNDKFNPGCGKKEKKN